MASSWLDYLLGGNVGGFRENVETTEKSLGAPTEGYDALHPPPSYYPGAAQGAVDAAPLKPTPLPKLDIPPLAPAPPQPDPSGYPEKWLRDRRVDEILRQKEVERQQIATGQKPPPAVVPGEAYAGQERGLEGPVPYGGPDLPPLARDIRTQQQKDAAAVVPPKTTSPDQPVVNPATKVEAPEVDASGLPGTSTETATGGLSLDDYIAKIKQAYPDLDFSNPKQAEADANARRDLDRTAMLAQLSLAAGMVKGAGTQWAGIGAGFEGAGAAYDKGFQKYQQALQDSADRYGKQMETQMTYDTARRKAALDLYTNAQTQAAETARTLWKEKSTRQWEKYKLDTETQREGVKLTDENINKYFDKDLEQNKPASDPSLADPAEEEKKSKMYRAALRARELSIRLHQIVPTENFINNLADK